MEIIGKTIIVYACLLVLVVIELSGTDVVKNKGYQRLWQWDVGLQRLAILMPLLIVFMGVIVLWTYVFSGAKK